MFKTLKMLPLAFSSIVQKNKHALSIIEGSTVSMRNYHLLTSIFEKYSGFSPVAAIGGHALCGNFPHNITATSSDKFAHLHGGSS